MASKKRNEGKESEQDVSQGIAIAERESEDDTAGSVWDEITALGIPHEWCVPIQCDQPGYEHLTIPFRVNNRFDITKRFKNLPEERTDLDTYKIMSLFVLGFEGWAFKDEITGEPIPAPRPSDPKSYDVLVERYVDLFRWCRFAGYTKALSTIFNMNVGGAKNSEPDSE